MELRHLHAVDAIRARHLGLEAGARERDELRHELGLDLEIALDIDALEAQVDVALEVQATGVRRQHFGEHAVLVTQTDLGRAERHDVKLALDNRRLGLHQEVRQPVLEARLSQRELLRGQPAQRIEQQVFARDQHIDEVALLEQQGAFVPLHMKLAKQKHFSSPFNQTNIKKRTRPPGRSAGAAACAREGGRASRIGHSARCSERTAPTRSAVAASPAYAARRTRPGSRRARRDALPHALKPGPVLR